MGESTEKITELQNILTQIFIQAEEDGIITKEEKELLNQIKIDLQEYNSLLKNALEDGVITEDEEKMLHQFKKKLLKSAYDLSRKDNLIDKDEREIISLLVKLLIHNEEP